MGALKQETLGIQPLFPSGPMDRGNRQSLGRVGSSVVAHQWGKDALSFLDVEYHSMYTQGQQVNACRYYVGCVGGVRG